MEDRHKNRLTRQGHHLVVVVVMSVEENKGKLTITMAAIAKDLNLASLCNALTSKCHVVYLPFACYRSELCITHFKLENNAK